MRSIKLYEEFIGNLLGEKDDKQIKEYISYISKSNIHVTYNKISYKVSIGGHIIESFIDSNHGEVVYKITVDQEEMTVSEKVGKKLYYLLKSKSSNRDTNDNDSPSWLDDKYNDL